MFPTIHGIVSQGGVAAPPEVEHAGFVSTTASLSTAANGFQLGHWFEVTQAMTAKAVRFRFPHNSIETYFLWRVSDETLLATGSIQCSNLQWVEQYLDTPVALGLGDYLVTAWLPGGGTRTSQVYSSIGSATVVNGTGFLTKGAVLANGTSYPTSFDDTRIRGICDIVYTLD